MVLEIARKFALEGQPVRLEEIPSGLINSTHRVITSYGRRYVLQSLNTHVFQKPQQVMENIRLVTDHICAKNPGFPSLHLVRTRHGESWWNGPNGSWWRCYEYLEEMEMHTVLHSEELAFQAGAAFGAFLAHLADLDVGKLHCTIPNFHHSPTYLAKLEHASKEDVHGRLATARKLFDFLMDHRDLAPLLVEAGLPERATHNDTKISNILFPLNPAHPPVVIDLDTVMPGLALCDYGDLVRSAAATGEEDDGSLKIDRELRRAITDGFLLTAAPMLTAAERELLPRAPEVIAWELAVRFYTDYLEGDQYFKVSHATQNLARAHGQASLLASMLGEHAPAAPATLAHVPA